MKKFLNSPKVVPYIMVLPFILMFFIIFLYPAISAVIMSFQKVNALNLSSAQWVGLQNYTKLFSDKHFLTAISNNLIYTVIAVVTNIFISMLLAYMLNSKMLKSRNVFKSILFLPALTSTVVAGIVFRLALTTQETGVMNQVIGLFGLEPFGWLTTRTGSFISLAILNIWLNVGTNIIYYLSGLQGIPVEIYESADIDGANAATKFFKITLPYLKPITVYVATMSVLAGLSMFTESYTLWSGKFAGDTGLTIVAYLYQTGFRQNDFGYASAVGIVLMILVLAVNLVQMTLNGSFKKEED